jgi:hypothetical protein
MTEINTTTDHLLPAVHSANISLQSTASWYMYTLLKDNRDHASFCVRVGHNFCVIFSNAKDEARSQHKHLHDRENLESTFKYLSFLGQKVLQK